PAAPAAGRTPPAASGIRDRGSRRLRPFFARTRPRRLRCTRARRCETERSRCPEVSASSWASLRSRRTADGPPHRDGDSPLAGRSRQLLDHGFPAAFQGDDVALPHGGRGVGLDAAVDRLPLRPHLAGHARARQAEAEAAHGVEPGRRHGAFDHFLPGCFVHQKNNTCRRMLITSVRRRRSAKKARMGEMSTAPSGGSRPRNRFRNGSVTLAINCTSGLYGSTGNHVSKMRMIRSHVYTSNASPTSRYSSKAKGKPPKTSGPAPGTAARPHRPRRCTQRADPAPPAL